MATEEVQIVITGKFKNKQAVVDALKTIDKGVKKVEEQISKNRWFICISKEIL